MIPKDFCYCCGLDLPHTDPDLDDEFFECELCRECEKLWKKVQSEQIRRVELERQDSDTA